MLWAVEQIVIFESKLNTRSGHFRGIRELQHNDEPNADEDERQVGQHHQTADALGVGTEGVADRHGLHACLE